MLSTIGYEGASLQNFIQTSLVAEIDTVVDVRDRAQSRRPGFSKTALQAALGAAGISYVHFKELGDPKEGREAARSNNYEKFQAIYSKVLESREAQAALEKITAAAASQNVCLLCYERDVTDCHRKLVSDSITRKTGEKARHLGVRQFEQDRQFA
jgi:uncharacterized protein (DUF488 family)